MQIDPEQLEALAQDYAADLSRFVRVLGASHAEADDAVQETFLQALQRPFEHRSRDETLAYLRTAAKHVFLKSLKRTRKIAPLDRDSIERDWAEFAGDDAAQAKVDALKECISFLDDRERQVLHLRYTRQATRAQMSEVLGLTEGGIKNLLERIKLKLRACVERKEKGPE